MTDAFIAEVRRSLRASLFKQLRPYGLGQDEITRLVASATTRAIALANVRDLATIAQAATPPIDALRVADPANPTLATYDAVRGGLSGPVRDLTEAQAVDV